MKIILFILSVSFLFSCKTVKEVVKVETKYDSTAIQEVQRLNQVLKYERETFESEREQWEKIGLSFYPFDAGINGGRDTIISDLKPREVPKIEFYDNGKIKSIEGRVKSLNQSLYEKSSELSEAYSKIDSLGIELEKKNVELSKKEKVLVKEVTRTTTPWWLLGLLIVIGWVGRGYWPRVKTFIIKKGL